MKKFLFQFVLLVIVILGSLYFFNPVSNSPAFDIPFLPQKPKLVKLEIGDKVFKVEVADTQSKRSKGLGGREKLASDEGMLFIFEKVDKYPFWMKGLKFPLDFIWINGDNIVDILPNAPEPFDGQTDESLPIYQPRVEIDKVLEINGGVAENLGIKIGDTVKLTR